MPVVLHALFAALVSYVDLQLDGHLGLPPSIVRPGTRAGVDDVDSPPLQIPSLSIVVGLMLVSPLPDRPPPPI